MAQLVARLVRNEKVRGSNPLSSTIKGRPRGRPFFVSTSTFTRPVPGAVLDGLRSDANDVARLSDPKQACVKGAFLRAAGFHDSRRARSLGCRD